MVARSTVNGSFMGMIATAVRFINTTVSRLSAVVRKCIGVIIRMDITMATIPRGVVILRTVATRRGVVTTTIHDAVGIAASWRR